MRTSHCHELHRLPTRARLHRQQFSGSPDDGSFFSPPTRGDSMQDQPLRRCVDVLSEREWPGARRTAGPAALSVLYVDSSQVVRSLRSLGAQQL